jgi:hypothetical protein
MNGMMDSGVVRADTFIDERIEALEERIRELRRIKTLLAQASGNSPSVEPGLCTQSAFRALARSADAGRG